MVTERLNSIAALRSLHAIILSDRDPLLPTIVIPAGTCGQASGANDLIRATKRELLVKRLTEKVRLRVTGCHGFCQMEPSVLIEPQGTFYPRLRMEQIPQIVDAAVRGEVVRDLLYKNPATGEQIEKQADIQFFKEQMRTILVRNEQVDPIRILNYIETGGYLAAAKALEQGDPVRVVEEVKLSGLRGRGGAGFSTGRKWELLAGQQGSKGKILVCNADEGDPGAYMDRSVLEGNPHSIIEGMLIGAFATGATEGVIYVRNEYPLAIKHLIIALRQARELGLLGQNILGTGFAFDISLVKGAGAFVCGEETALIRSVEGKMGEPRQRPPYPVQRGIDGKPTAINNVETWANIPVIIGRGGIEFARIGAAKNAGTKIFSLVGKVKNTGLVEVPMGVSINHIVNDIGGGPVGRAKIKAVQTGGPSGGCIPARMFDLPIDYDSLVSAGSIMGSGGMIVMDENTCMVDVAKYFMDFLKDESCGKCLTCRKGTQRMYEILEDIAQGKGSPGHLDLLEELALVVKDASMCGLGQSAPNPVLSTLRYFREEFQRHIHLKRCDAFVCRELVCAPCATACPLGTEAWRYIAHIARGEFDQAYQAIRETNPFPSVCARVCNHPCEERCRAGTHGGQSVAIRALKRFITDRVDPSVYRPVRTATPTAETPQIAIVGSGPAGLTAAHFLSLRGFRSTVFEMDSEPGGMLYSAIPSYRLPREIIRKEIHSLLDDNITIRCNTKLGRDVTIDTLFEEGYRAIFIALGAHKSLPLHLRGEDLPGVFPSIQFLKAFNMRVEMLARGRVGIIGGGNSAVDAARVAIRQPEVKSVTIFYRRTRDEMPAFPEEIEAALQEGVRLETLVAPVGILAESGMLSGIECINNELGDVDPSGRRRPVAVPGTQHVVPLNTLIVAISEGSDTDCLAVAGANQLDVDETRGTIRVDPETLCTNRPGVFAGGDVVTGPNTVVDAIAAGRRAAVMIERYLNGEGLVQPHEIRRPRVHVEPVKTDGRGAYEASRIELPRLDAQERKQNFQEVEKTLSREDALHEARRCLRCDLEFLEKSPEEETLHAMEEAGS
jgi:NADH-quinone oxidoreductase subunit F